MAEDEEKRNNAVQYILAHLDQIASLPKDTLALAFGMITNYSDTLRLLTIAIVEGG